jgi:hypothetical protein
LRAGYKTEQALSAAGIATAADLRAVPHHTLLQQFGQRVGAFLHSACYGQVSAVNCCFSGRVQPTNSLAQRVRDRLAVFTSLLSSQASGTVLAC